MPEYVNWQMREIIFSGYTELFVISTAGRNLLALRIRFLPTVEMTEG